MDRATAARFSFLLAMPVTLAVAVKELPALPGSPSVGGLAIAIGVGTSFGSGLLAIAFLLRYLASHRV
jgi:undecaprenyl pyrophosphate phosphatase UppP